MTVKFSVPGPPQGKGRPRFSNIRGKIITRTPEETVIYENLIITEYQRQCGKARFPDNEPLEMRVVAYYAIPQSASKKKQKLMENGELRPTKTPDADNVIKSVADALNQVAYRDDAQIVDCQIHKYYSHIPQVVITIHSAS